MGFKGNPSCSMGGPTQKRRMGNFGRVLRRWNLSPEPQTHLLTGPKKQTGFQDGQPVQTECQLSIRGKSRKLKKNYGKRHLKQTLEGSEREKKKKKASEIGAKVAGPCCFRKRIRPLEAQEIYPPSPYPKSQNQSTAKGVCPRSTELRGACVVQVKWLGLSS